MGNRMIALKFESVCRECGATLQVGEQARYYGRGIVYGITCHKQLSEAERKAKWEQTLAKRQAWKKAQANGTEPQGSKPAPAKTAKAQARQERKAGKAKVTKLRKTPRPAAAPVDEPDMMAWVDLCS